MRKPKDRGGTATWERDLKIIFCDLWLREIDLGNRSTTHLNKEGWINFMKNFQERTGLEYNKTQLMNQWNQLKKDWKLWKELKLGSTGLMWDLKRKTIEASDEWWKEKLKAVPNAKKFRYCGIDPELEEKFDLMFLGSHAWTPSHRVEDLDGYGDSEQIDNTNGPSADPFHNMDYLTEFSNSKQNPFATSPGERTRRCGSTFLRKQISQLVNTCTKLISQSTTSQPVFAPPSISDAIKVLDRTTEVFENIPLYLFSTQLLEDPKKREIFMAMAPERRVHYLLYCFENLEA